MHPAYIFTQEDKINPVFCRQCRAHIPRQVSAGGKGICPDCIAANELERQRQEAEAQQIAADFAAQRPVLPPSIPERRTSTGGIWAVFAVLLIIAGTLIANKTHQDKLEQEAWMSYKASVCDPVRQEASSIMTSGGGSLQQGLSIAIQEAKAASPSDPKRRQALQECFGD